MLTCNVLVVCWGCVAADDGVRRVDVIDALMVVSIDVLVQLCVSMSMCWLCWGAEDCVDVEDDNASDQANFGRVYQ